MSPPTPHIRQSYKVEHPNDDEGTHVYQEVDGEWFLEQHNQGGYDLTRVRLRDVAGWIREYAPELLEAPGGP